LEKQRATVAQANANILPSLVAFWSSVGSGRHRAFPGHTRQAMGKPRERDPTQATLLHTPGLLHPCVESRSSCLPFALKAVILLGTVKLGYVVSCLQQKS